MYRADCQENHRVFLYLQIEFVCIIGLLSPAAQAAALLEYVFLKITVCSQAKHTHLLYVHSLI